MASHAEFINALIGLPYRPGAGGPDAWYCLSLHRYTQRVLFDRDVPVIDVDPAEPGAAEHIHAELSTSWVRRPDGERPQTGDTVVMSSADELRHLGTWFDLDGGGVLHAYDPAGVCFDTLAHLRREGWRRLQVYRWVEGAEVPTPFAEPLAGPGASAVFQVVAEYIAAALTYVGVGTETALAIGQGIVQMGLMIGGKMLLSAIMPGPSNKSVPSASPTYSVNGQSNQARLGQPIPEWFGEFCVTCDLAAMPYVDYQDNDQQLYQLFVIGRGSYAISQLRLGSNVFAEADETGALISTGTYPEITWEIIEPDGTVSLFPDNVVTSTEVNNIQLLGTNEDGADWTAWFVCNPSGTETNKLAFDLALPAGLFHSASNGSLQSAEVNYQFEVQQIDDNGDPLGNPTAAIDSSVVRSTVDPQRFSVYATVEAGRWRARGKRTNVKGPMTSTQDTLIWLSLRAFLPPVGTYGDATLVALRYSASKNINQTSSLQFNAVVTRKLPVYDAETKIWSEPQPTRSIAWAVAYTARKRFADARIDLDWLAQYDAIWAGRGDTFDGGFDTAVTFWNGLNAILAAGRAQAIYSVGELSFVRDEPKAVYRTGFSPLNMAAGSFSRAHQFFTPNTVEALLVRYIDRRDWKQHVVLCKLDGSDATVDTATPFDFLGINNYAQAWREGITKIAASRYRRIFPSFTTKGGGRVCFRGDLVKLAHWSADWGHSAEAIALERNDGGDILTLSEPWRLTADGTRLVTIAAPDGQLSDAVPIELMDDGSTTLRARVRLLESAAPSAGKYAGLEPRNWKIWGFDNDDNLQIARPRVTMGQGSQVPRDALIVSTRPGQNRQVSVSAVLEDARVHEADQGDPPAEPDPPQVPSTENLQITALDIRETLDPQPDNENVLVTVTAAGAPDGVSFEYQTRWNGAPDWSDIVDGQNRIFQFRSREGSLALQVRAVGATGNPGPWFERDFDADGVIDVVSSTFDFTQKPNSSALAVLAGAWRL